MKPCFPKQILAYLTVFTMAAYTFLSILPNKELSHQQQMKQFKEYYEQQMQWQQELQKLIENFEAKFSRNVENQLTEMMSKKRTEIESNEMQIYNSFKPLMTAEETKQYMELFEVFHNVTEESNISYFIDSGTLIGAFRHGGFIPWDDDIDVQIHENDTDKLISALKSQAPKYEHYVWTSEDEGESENVVNMKFFPADGKIINSKRFPAGCKWKWPFMDIFFYKMNSKWISLSTSRIYAYPKEVFFPHDLVRFENLLVYAPRLPEVIFNLEYNLSECISPRYNHREEDHFPVEQDKKVPCKELERLPLFNCYTFHDYI
ncbi:uncharacterized protein LOC135499273 [Lineus longissimus]|uniref:uncharacterized protein LOC135499273 n=1 Tax=Lineus longissimus TaxID=88925 RepID=UPI002B4E7142